MNNARVMGFCFLVIGAVFAADGLVTEPVRWLRIGIGVVFAMIGIFRLVQSRAAKPPSN